MKKQTTKIRQNNAQKLFYKEEQVAKAEQQRSLLL